MVPAAIYARVSTDMQAEYGGGLEDQIRFCSAVCRRNEYDLIEVVRDGGMSGATDNRPLFWKAVAALRERGGGVLLVRDFARASRDAAFRLSLPALLAQDNIILESATEGVADVDDEARYLGYGVGSVVAHWLRLHIARLTSAAFARHRREGRHHGGKAPYGYERVDGQLVEEPVAAAVVRDVFRWADEGYGKTVIAKWLTGRSIPRPDGTGKPWQDSTIAHILRNPVLVGRVVHRYRRKKRLPQSEWQVYEGQHEAIVPPEQFDRVQSILASRSYKARANHGHEFLLTGLLRCPYCGGRMHGAHQWTPRAPYPVYRCTTNTHTGTCRALSRSARKWEAEFIRVVTEDIRNTTAERKVWTYAAPRDGSDTERITAELMQIHEKRIRLHGALGDGRFSQDIIADQLAQLDRREGLLRGQAILLDAAQADEEPPIDIRGVQEALLSPNARVVHKRAAMARLIKRIEWADKDSLRIVFR
jgi:site-specific DNA recombinase